MRRDRSDEFANFKPKPREAAQVPGVVKALGDIFGLEFKPVPPTAKTPGRKRKALTDAAREEPCLVRITGCCNHRTDTTVAAHWPGIAGGRGMGMKSIDLAIAFACSACHDVVDGRAPLPAGATREAVLLDWCRGHLMTLERLLQKGLL
jgi:hypothetical protein